MARDAAALLFTSFFAVAFCAKIKCTSKAVRQIFLNQGALARILPKASKVLSPKPANSFPCHLSCIVKKSVCTTLLWLGRLGN